MTRSASTYQEFDNKDLFALVAAGDEAAFRQLFNKFLPELGSAIKSVVHSDTATKDIIQEVFIQIWISRDKLTAVELPRNWLFQVTYFLSYKWLRSQKNQEKLQSGLKASNPTDNSNTVWEQLDFNETTRLIREAVVLLPEKARKIYILSRDQHLKISEIAAALGISEQTVKNSLTRSLASIREHLLAHGISIPVFILCFFSNQ
ncbi:RNA polymerase sigma factor [Pseudoflavitalea rhizosphaerae]|uniref:RNA polymerase sigma factor n=1 Tax=Pseudoflavitalea rhizosphaerae TaxID=1884793 RepID=UPI000F8CF389|nr:sigma-70 family RNA polymerase sigma factor [Pseudoflavitalea rhizosphaerae]